MTATDWPALAARFEAATDETVYECVRELRNAVWNPWDDAQLRKWAGANEVCESAGRYRNPDLLLGVVATCVPENITATEVYSRGAGTRWHVILSRLNFVEEEVRYEGFAPSEVAARGAAVCRAWQEVEKGEVG